MCQFCLEDKIKAMIIFNAKQGDLWNEHAGEKATSLAMIHWRQLLWLWDSIPFFVERWAWKDKNPPPKKHPKQQKYTSFHKYVYIYIHKHIYRGEHTHTHKVPNTQCMVYLATFGATPMYWFIMVPYKSPPFGSGNRHLLSPHWNFQGGYIWHQSLLLFQKTFEQKLCWGDQKMSGK